LDKADLFDELRAEIGSVADGWKGNDAVLYEAVCQLVYDQVEEYKSVSIYLTNHDHFKRKFHQGSDYLPEEIPFGETELSIAALRGGLSCHNDNTFIQLCIPFYYGHHLIGEIVIIAESSDNISDDDYTFFSEIASLLENKLQKYK
jgi:putative methionine-R-sulfoxide reductase with GAF domain